MNGTHNETLSVAAMCVRDNPPLIRSPTPTSFAEIVGDDVCRKENSKQRFIKSE
jgi:hypothetical protein